MFAAIGHWQGTWNNSGINAKPAFLLEARLDYPDGSSSTIGTDESWKVLAHTAFIETNATYFSRAEAGHAALRRKLQPHIWTIPDGLAHLPRFVEPYW